MQIELAPSEDLGLRHVLEDGLAVLRSNTAAADRRDALLDRLIEIFSEADKGSRAAEARHFLFAIEQPVAFERFALFVRYLNDMLGPDLPTRLTEATGALKHLREHNVRQDQELDRAAGLIESLISAIRADAALQPLESPVEFDHV